MAVYLLVLIYLINDVSGTLNSTDYNIMPPLYHLDNYEECLHNVEGVYCNVEFTLVSDTRSDLLEFIREYSNHVTRLNHSTLHYGICLTSTCEATNKTLEYKQSLEGRLNESFWKTYQLKTKVTDLYCHKNEQKIVEIADLIFIAVCLWILVCNLVGSLYEIFLRKMNKKKGVPILHCFSIQRNWMKLIAPSGDGPDPRIKRLKGFNGLKTMTILAIISGHAMMPFVYGPENPRFFEESYDDIFYHLLYNGTVVVQTFFLLSGFLLVYNIQIYLETHDLTWMLLPKGIIMRWLRLIPPYAVILALTTTWMRFVGDGPIWQTAVGIEVEDCRRDWWMHLLFINNYNPRFSNCMMQTWYLASDMQLCCVGLIICILTKSGNTRKVVLSVFFLAGVIIPGAHTYCEDLDGVVVAIPERVRTLFRTDPTFNLLYKRGHTNLGSFIIGMAFGHLVYHLQETRFDITKYRKYRYIYWCLFPFGVGAILLSRVFYVDERPAIFLRVLFACLLKNSFAIGVGLFILGMVFEIESVYRSILEWDGWATPGRLSYSAYLLHIPFIRAYTGTMSTLVKVSTFHMMTTFFGLCCVTFITAVPFFLLVEAPIGQVFKLLMNGSSGSKEETTRTGVCNQAMELNEERKTEFEEKMFTKF